MNRSFSRVPTLLCLLALPIAACAGERAEDVATDGAELRKLLPSEIVGSISYGETKTVTYAAEPRYRAFSFHAKQGDKIDARFVGAKGLDTVGFLLSDTFATVKQNDDESTASRASRFTHEISTTGTYYLAVREANEEDGQITISLTKVDGATPPPPPVEPPPPTPGQAFNPRSCTGNVLTQARAIKYFPKGSASGRVTISAKPGRAYLRARVCSEFSGCADWVEKDVTKPSADGALRANYGNMFDTSPAGVALSLVDRADDPVDLFMAVSAGSRTWATGYVNSTHRLELRGYERPGAVRVTPYGAWDRAPLSSGEETWATNDKSSLHGYVRVPVTESGLDVIALDAVDWETTINETCAQARFSTSRTSSGQQQRVELQGVVHWDLVAPTNP